MWCSRWRDRATPYHVRVNPGNPLYFEISISLIEFDVAFPGERVVYVEIVWCSFPVVICFPDIPLCLAGCSKARPEGSVESDAAELRTTTTKREWSVAGVVTSKSETSTTEPIHPETPDRPEARPQSSNLTAGDYDDLLNPAEYAAYASRYLQKTNVQLPFVDTRNRVEIKVLDAGGKAVPFARLDIARKNAPLRLITAANGAVSLYPAFDGVSGPTKVSVISSAGNGNRVLNLGKTGGASIVIKLPGAGRSVSAMDVVLVIDTTGSMSDEMEYLQAELDAIVARLKREGGNLDLRIGLIVYRDEDDDYVVRSSPLTTNIGAVRDMLSRQAAGGGGDIPEAVDRAMIAAETMQWRPEAAKALILVADAPPHKEGLASTLEAAQNLRSRGVQIVPVGASGVEDTAQYVMRTMAAMTQGRYVFLTDDSGIGDAHAEPDVACYVVTRLDQLIGRILAGIAQGRRIEPRPEEVIRTVGNYDRGRCRPAPSSNAQ